MSGPLLDRFDLHVEMPALDYDQLAVQPRGEPSITLRERVAAARERQVARFGGRAGTPVNARMSAAEVEQWARPDADGRELLRQAMSRLGLSARAHERILKVARTIADLADCAGITPAHVAEGIQYRCLDREG